MLKIQTLGTLNIVLDNDSCLDHIGINGALLLVYLAVEVKAQSRSDMAALLWPREEKNVALTRLGALISRMLREGLASQLEVTSSQVAWMPNAEVDVDVWRLRHLTAEPENAAFVDLLAAAELYTGPFLQQTALDAYPALATWAQTVSADLSDRVKQVVVILQQRAVTPEQHDFALKHAMRLYQLEMQASTQASTLISTEASDPADPAHRSERVFGRHRENEILAQYLEAKHRLISIIGLGGIGKTFFVRSQEANLRERFGQNVYFVDLRCSGLSTTAHEEAVIGAIGAAMSFSPQVGPPLLKQIISHLQRVPHCLVLDNFETFINARMLLLHLIQSVSHLTLIVTTRTALHFSNESRLHMLGLSVDDRRRAPRSADGVDSEAVGFFVHCVRRHHPNFMPTAEDMEVIRSICRLVAGVPLAIELASLHLDVYSLSALRDRISQGIDVLVQGADDLPGNHHSMQALLDAMWQTLDSEEQQTLSALSLFAGSWHRDAMLAVAPASRSVYTNLVNASMLHVEEAAWFSMHPLVKQYVAERLRNEFAADAPAHRHAVHFLSLLNLGESPFDWTKCQVPDVLHRLQRRLYDVESAWQWAVAHGEWTLLADAVISLVHLFILSGQARRGSLLLSALMDVLPPPAVRTPLQVQLAGRVALFLSYLNILYGDLAAAKPWAKPAVAWLDAAGTPYDQAVVRLHCLWRSMQFAEEMETAFAMVPKALALAEQQGLSLLRIKILATNALVQHLPAGDWKKSVEDARSVIAALPGLASITQDVLINATAILCTCLYLRDAAAALQTAPRPIQKDTAVESVSYYDTSSIMEELLKAELLAADGNLDAATVQVESVLPLYVEHYSGQASLAYGLLSLCQARNGDLKHAIDTARQGVAHGEQFGGVYLSAYARLRLAEVLILAGQNFEAQALLHDVLSVGQALNETTLIFSALYNLMIVHRNEAPRDLYEHILKIGAASPALYYEMHPVAVERLYAEGIVLTEVERKRLYNTDLAAVKALAEKVGVGHW